MPLQTSAHIQQVGVGNVVLALLWCRALRAWSLGAVPIALSGFLIAFGFGLILEWQQVYILGRVASASDAALNAVGALIAAYVYVVSTRRLQARSTRYLSNRAESIRHDA